MPTNTDTRFAPGTAVRVGTLIYPATIIGPGSRGYEVYLGGVGPQSGQTWDVPEEELSTVAPEDEDTIYYCPHGVEVESSGGACYYCAQEDARDDDFDW